MSVWFGLIGKIGAEKQPGASFNWRKFLECSGMWLFGGVLAFIPVGIMFILNPVEKLTLKTFFNYEEIIYVTVTMAVIALCDKTRKKTGVISQITVLMVITGVALYGMLKGRVEIPVLAGDGLPVFNMIFLLSVLCIGLFGYVAVCIEKGVRVK